MTDSYTDSTVTFAQEIGPAQKYENCEKKVQK